jgi:release factor glutamine methyltransferase
VSEEAACTVGLLLTEATAALAKAGCDQPRRRARQLIAASLGISATELLMRPELRLGGSKSDRLRGLISRMARGEPLSRVVGRRAFWSLEFALSDATLDPRPESETVVEAVLARVSDRGGPLTLLDLGTGTGCILLALLSELPAAFGVGVDLSEGAAATARRNAQALGLAYRACFFVGDWGAALGRRFDVIVANPPYIATAALADLPHEVGAYDPLGALDGGEDGLAAYRAIAANAPALLKPSGLLAVEVGAGQAPAATAILQGCGLLFDATERDLAGIERCVVTQNGAHAHAVAAEGGQKSLGISVRPV